MDAECLSHSAFGGWIRNNGSSFDLGMVSGGNLSLDTPTTGSATYTGKTVGVGATGTQSFAFVGDANLTADFAALTVTSSFSNLVTQDLNTDAIGSLPNINGTATIDHFSDGTSGYDGTVSSNGFTGTISGDFYGPAAAETAGTWTASDGATDLIGSFGAAQ